MIRTVYKFLEDNIDYIQFNVRGDYELQEKESFDISGFHTPKWDEETNKVIEGATQEEVDQRDIDTLDKQIAYEAINLKRGAKRIVLEIPEGETVDLDELIRRKNLVYKWAKGELTNDDAYTDIDEQRTKALIDINTARGEDDQLTEEQYRGILIKEGVLSTTLLTTYEVMINDALEKIERLKENRDLPEAKAGMILIQNVSKAPTPAEASALLTQILDL